MLSIVSVLYSCSIIIHVYLWNKRNLPSIRISSACSQTLTIPKLTPKSSSGNSRDSIILDCLTVRLPVPTSSQRFAWDTCRSWCNTHIKHMHEHTQTGTFTNGDDTWNNILQHNLRGEVCVRPCTQEAHKQSKGYFAVLLQSPWRIWIKYNIFIIKAERGMIEDKLALQQNRERKMRCNSRGSEWNAKQSRAGSVIARSLFLPPFPLASF